MSDWRTERDRALLTLENDQRREVRAEAANALLELASGHPRLASEFGPAIVRLLADSQVEVRCAGVALAAVTLSPDEAEGVLIRYLADPAPRVRVEAVGQLADLARPNTRGVFATAMRDQHFVVRFEAARGMAALKHSSGLEILVEALDDPDLLFRALGALAELGDPQALPAIRRVFRRWMLPAFERTQAAGAMARFGDEEGVRHLFKRAERRWSLDRAMAIELLGEVKAAGAFERLVQILHDPRDDFRGAAARGLGRLADERSLAALNRVLVAADTPEELRVDAAEGMLLLATDAAREQLSLAMTQLRSSETRTEIQQLLGEPR